MSTAGLAFLITMYVATSGYLANIAEKVDLAVPGRSYHKVVITVFNSIVM